MAIVGRVPNFRIFTVDIPVRMVVMSGTSCARTKHEANETVLKGEGSNHITVGTKAEITAFNVALCAKDLSCLIMKAAV